MIWYDDTNLCAIQTFACVNLQNACKSGSASTEQLQHSGLAKYSQKSSAQ